MQYTIPLLVILLLLTSQNSHFTQNTKSAYYVCSVNYPWIVKFFMLLTHLTWWTLNIF